MVDQENIIERKQESMRQQNSKLHELLYTETEKSGTTKLASDDSERCTVVIS